MSRIADSLERESRTVDLAYGDFDRLLARRERKQRNRRIRAGALGAIVALATGIVLARSLASDGVPAGPPVEPRPAPAAEGTLAYVLDGDVYVADPDGSNAVRIADGRSAEDCYGFSGEYWAEGLMWSPDGRYLAFRRFTDCGGESPYPRDVVITVAEGNMVATFPAEGWEIAWSSDATRVAVWDRFPDTIGIYGLDGVRQAQLTMPPWWERSGDVDPSWTPDGASLVVDHVLLPLDGGTPRRISEGDPAYGGEEPDGPPFSVDVDGRSMNLVRSDGSVSVTLLTAEPGTDLGFIGFSPEGDRILFSRIENGEPSLWSIGIDGSDARLVVAGTVQGEWLSR